MIEEPGQASALAAAIEKLPTLVWKRIEGPGALSGELTAPFEPMDEERLVRVAEVLALLAGVSADTTQVEELQKTIRILELATPLEEDLSNRIDEMCKHLAMQDGFTLNGIARLLIDTQKRMAADWIEIGSLRRQLKAGVSAERSEKTK